MKYRKVDITSEHSDKEDSDEEKTQSNDFKHHHEIKKIVKTLKHPTDSHEFMDHLLSQTMKVDNLRGLVKKCSCLLGLVAFILFFYNLLGYGFNHMDHLKLVVRQRKNNDDM